MVPLCGSLEHTHADVEIMTPDHHRGERHAPRLSLQVARLRTLCIRYLRPLPRTQNTGCPCDGAHHPWCRARCEGLACTACASILPWPASPQQGWGRAMAQLQLGVKIPGRGAQEGRWPESSLPPSLISYSCWVPGPSLSALPLPQSEQQD